MYLLANYQPDEYLAMGTISPEEVSGLLSAQPDPTQAFATLSSASSSAVRPPPSPSATSAPVALDLSGGSVPEDLRPMSEDRDVELMAAQAPAPTDKAPLSVPPATAADEVAARQRAEAAAEAVAAAEKAEVVFTASLYSFVRYRTQAIDL